GGLMAEPYIGSFVITPPVISGRVTDTNGAPVAYVTMHVGDNFFPVLTDTNGFYSLEVPAGFSGTIRPSKDNWGFIPAARTYTNVTASAANQNFLMVTPHALALTHERQGANFLLGWQGLNGVSYQPVYSTNLVDWWPC